MDKFDDIFKKNFRDEQESVKAKEEKELWDSIVEELGDKNSISPVGTPLFSRRYTILILGLILLFSAYFIGKEQAEKNFLSEKKGIGMNVKSEKNANQVYSDSSISDQIQEINGRTNIQSNTKEEGIKLNKHNTRQDNIGNAQKNIDLTTEKAVFDKDLFSQDGINSSKETVNKAVTQPSILHRVENDNFHKKTTFGEFENQVQQSNFDQSEENKTKEGITSELPKNNHSESKNELIIQEEETNSSEIEDAYISNPIAYLRNKVEFDEPVVVDDKKALSPYKFSISTMGGVNISGINYSGSNSTIVDIKNASESFYYGSNVGLDLGVEYTNRWLFSTGIYYDVQKTIFNLEGFEDRSMLRENFVSGILINYGTKELIEEYVQDSTFVTNSYFRIQQINSFTSYMIPIQLGWKQSVSRVDYGLMIGAQMRFRIDQTAKVIDINNEILDLNKDSNLFTNPLDIALSFAPFLEYRITNKWGLKMVYNLQVYRPTISLDQSLILNNYIQRLNGGLTYRL